MSKDTTFNYSYSAKDLQTTILYNTTIIKKGEAKNERY